MRQALGQCRSSGSRKRSRDGHGRDGPRRREDHPWEDDEDADFMSDPGRSVCWSANGLTIRARNTFSDMERMPPPKRSRDERGGIRPLPSRRRDPYDLWGMDEADLVLRPEYRARDFDRQEEFRYRENDSPRPLGLVNVSSSYRREDGRRHEPRGYALERAGGKRGEWHARERDTPRRRAETEHSSWERSCSRRLSPPPPPPPRRSSSDYVDRQRRLSPPRLQLRDRREEYDINQHHAWENDTRHGKPRGFVKPDSPRSEAGIDPRTCYKCGRVGHLRESCPLKECRGERSPKRSAVVIEDSKGKTCFTCGRVGHFSFQCPAKAGENPKPADGGRGKQCYTCGDFGHVSYECPLRDSDKDAPRRCGNCYEIGHLVHECPMFQDGEPKSEVVEDDSNVVYKTRLTEAERSQYLRENRCFTCRKLGHPYYSCPQSEKRLEYVFNDREHKSSWKLLKNPCWKYMDSYGEWHGPVSLAMLGSMLAEGAVSGDFQACHMYNGGMQPMSVGKLVRISKSELLVAILSCMPEAVSFLGEDMDAADCKANVLTALQTKIHYDIFETTVRWIAISSINEGLQEFISSRKRGRSRAPAAEDYLEPDKSGPPQTSDCELSPADGTRDGAGHGTNTMMLVECETFAKDSSLEDPKSVALEAIQRSIHSRVLGGVRTGILDATTAKCLDSWIQPRKLELAQVAEVISEEHSGDCISKGSSPSPVGTRKILGLKDTEKKVSSDHQQQQKHEAEESERQRQQMERQRKKQQRQEEAEQQRQEKEQQRQQKEPRSSDHKSRKSEVKTSERESQRQRKEQEKLEQQKNRDLKSSDQKQQKQHDRKPSEQKKQVKESEQQKRVKESELQPQVKESELQQQVQSEQHKQVKESEQQQTQEKTVSEQKKLPVLVPKLEEGAVALNSGNQEKQEDAPELVLRIFRKKKNSPVIDLTESLPDDSSRPAKKRLLKLCDLYNNKATELEPSHKLQKVEEDEAAEMDVDEVSDDPEDSSEPVKDEEKQEEPNLRFKSSCPRSSGCARSSISGWDWREWSRTFKSFEKSETVNGSSTAVKTVRPPRSTRCSRAQARRRTGVSDGPSHLKARKKLLKLEPSSIHSWGVVTMEPIEAEDFVVEYVGELIRPKVADLRESRYLKQATGSSYFFRIGDEHVIDATVRGNQARFINHSCEPNCYTKVISVEGRKRVFIYARRFIPAGTELTYDYKFPREENDKLPCFCGTPKCRGSLN